MLSVITASFNAGPTLGDCLESVKAQSVPVEHILVDGGSTDNTLEIARGFDRHLARIISEPDQGIYDAMNKGLRFASGEVVGILNADDFYTSADTLVKVMAVFEDKSVEACYGDLLYVDNGNIDKVIRYWRSGPFNRRKFYWGWMPPHPTFFVRRTVYERYGFFRLDLGSAADYELMLRFLLKYKISVQYIPETLVKMRTGGASNTSLKKRLQANSNDRLAWKINEIKPYPWTLILKPLSKIGQFFTKA